MSPRRRVVSFRTSKADHVRILAIVERAIPLTKRHVHNLELTGSRAEIRDLEARRKNLSMDLAATHANGCLLDFQVLLGFDDFNFNHDIDGISACLNRQTGALGNYFVPRCAKRTPTETRQLNRRKKKEAK